ncbi:MAG: hypothetical protein LUF34_09235 [Lachnospiraceae bacterium]|nr:hypothetical protein [Lachnospiraceae bacterium]
MDRMLISDLLSAGSQAARTAGELEKITGLNNRELRLAIEAERREGTPLLSDTRNGECLPDTDDARRRFVASMRNRAKEILLTAQAVEKGGAAFGKSSNV